VTDRPDPLLADLAGELEALQAALRDRPGPDARDGLKRRLVALYRRVETLATGVEELRDGIRGLAERFKEAAGPEPAAGAGPAAPPAGIRADHLGASTFVEKGWGLIALGDHAGAEQALLRALELAPGAVEARSLLGWARMLAGRYDEALATFSEVLADEPDHALARVNVGYICVKKRIYGEAIEHLSRVIRLDNDRKATLYAHYYLGLVYLEREMYVDAQTFLAKALALGPNLIEACYDLGRAQWFAGDHDAARATWRRGATANRFAAWSKRCRDLLDAVERGEPVPRSSSAA
jgi:tetratricopeptide (TPR) repeat protein